MQKYVIYLLFFNFLVIGCGAKSRSEQILDQYLCALEWAYDKGQTTVPDAVYDGLSTFRARKIHEPLACYSAVVLNRQAHTFFMGSLRKAESPKAIQTVLSRIQRAGSECLLQPKVDGLAVELVYKQGILVAASTRGNGYQGKDIYQLVRLSGQIPHYLFSERGAIQSTVVLHGELYLRRDLAGDQLKDFRKARHKVAGLAAQKKPDTTWAIWLDFYPWQWVNSPNVTLAQDIWQLSHWGFHFILEHSHKVDTLNDIECWWQAYKQQQAMHPMLTDGVVIKANQVALLKSDQGKRLPDHAMAWKFAATTAIVEIKKIYWRTGRTGRKTAIIAFDPVRLGHSTIEKVAAGGVAHMKKLAINVGDIISIAFKGQAIPVFDRVVMRF